MRLKIVAEILSIIKVALLLLTGISHIPRYSIIVYRKITNCIKNSFFENTIKNSK